MGCFRACACFGHWKNKPTIKHQRLSSREELQDRDKVLVPDAESIREEEIASLIKLVAQSQAAHEKQTKENENGGNEDKTENQGRTSDPAADDGSRDFLIKECVAEAVQLKEMITSDDNGKGDADFRDCSSESLFSLSIDSRKRVYTAEMGDKEVSSPLKPLEDTSYEDKGNVNFIGKQSGSVKQSGSKLDRAIAVDTSLSSWLAGSEKTLPQNTSSRSSPESEKNYGDRQILGVISPAVESKQLKESTPCCSCDDQSEFGTVGRYWRRTGVTSQ